MNTIIIILLAISIIVKFNFTLNWKRLPHEIQINIFPIIVLILFLINS